MQKNIDYLYEPVYSEPGEFLPVELFLAEKYVSLLERMHNKEKLTIYEQFSLLRLNAWFRKQEKHKREKLLHYVV